MNYKKYISLDTNKRFGKPIVTGTRISVYDVLNWLANGMSIKDIINDFPELDDEKIKACLAYAAQRKNRIRVAS